jgi:hypothetical protein
MPGSVGNANPVTVMPWHICQAFSHSREFVARENEYRNGESQRDQRVNTSRKSWKLVQRLTPAALAILSAFYDARKGPVEAFYFYDIWDTSPQFQYDPTGVATTGRYIVRFDSIWEQTSTLARSNVSLALIELA